MKKIAIFILFLLFKSFFSQTVESINGKLSLVDEGTSGAISDPNKVLDLSLNLYKESNTIGYEVGKTKALLYMSYVYSLRGDLTKGFKSIDEGTSIAKNNDDYESQAKFNLYKMRLLLYLENYDEMDRLINENYKLLEKIKPSDGKNVIMTRTLFTSINSYEYRLPNNLVPSQKQIDHMSNLLIELY